MSRFAAGYSCKNARHYYVRFSYSIKNEFNCANILILTCTYELKQRAVNLTALTVIREY